MEAHLTEKADLLARLTAAPAKPAPAVESYAEACIENAAAVKHAICDCGKSREQMADAINACFGWKEELSEVHLRLARVSIENFSWSSIANFKG